MEKTIYDLELHETISLPFGMVVMRVASGWIYDCWDHVNDQFKSGVFVPFDNKRIASKLWKRKAN